jgi:hypothetical protein
MPLRTVLVMAATVLRFEFYVYLVYLYILNMYSCLHLNVVYNVLASISIISISSMLIQLFYKECLHFNPLTPELNPSEQRCLTRFFTGHFAS